MSKPDRYGWFDDWVGEYLDWDITLTPARMSSSMRFLELVGAEFLPSKEPCGIPALADEGTPDHVLVGVAPAPGKPGWVLGAELAGTPVGRELALAQEPRGNQVSVAAWRPAAAAARK